MKNRVFNHTNSHRYYNLQKFTLIELLVVIGILSILFAMLSPALQIAKEQGRSIFCINNLHNMVHAAHSYVLDYEGSFPIAYYTTNLKTFAWDVNTSWELSPDGNWKNLFKPGILYEGMDLSSNDNAVFQCPSFDGSDMFAGETYTGYNYNTSYLGHGKPEPAKIGMVKSPSATVIFGDGGYDGGTKANKFMRAPFGNQNFGDCNDFNGHAAGTQHFRHLGHTNVSFVDGHANSLSEIFRNSYNFEMGNVYGSCGWLSEDDSLYDLK